MEENFNKNKDLGNQQINFIKKIRKNFYNFTFYSYHFCFVIFFNTQSKKNNSLIAEKYIQAGIFLSLEENEKSKKIYEEIIKSKINFILLLLFLL